MRREARECSQEMYSRSQLSPNNTNPDKVSSDKNEEINKGNCLLNELFGGALDSDKLLIAALMLLLLREGGDKKLILALGYILF